MAVNLTWSYTDGGNAIADFVDHGDVANGNNSSGEELYLRHDGENSITGVALFIREFSGTYDGDATSNADIVELLDWGDSNTAGTFGGVQINWDAVNAYAAGWPTYDDKDPGDVLVHRTGVGDSEQNAVTLPTSTMSSAEPIAGEIIAGTTPGVRFKMRISVPSEEDTVGVRLFDHVAKYTYTS